MLRSKDFLFRPLEPNDAPAHSAAVRESLATLAPWMPWAHAGFSEADAMEWIALCRQWWDARANFEFGIFDTHTAALVGGCGLNQFNGLHGYCNLGYWVRETCQRRGAATQAIGALAAYAFEGLGVGRVEIAVGVGNTASLAAARKAGACEEGVARNRLRLGDRFIDAHLLSLVRADLA
jgi:RimJ/RimL family protein N-acetyltransferase